MRMCMTTRWIALIQPERSITAFSRELVLLLPLPPLLLPLKRLPTARGGAVAGAALAAGEKGFHKATVGTNGKVYVRGFQGNQHVGIVVKVGKALHLGGTVVGTGLFIYDAGKIVVSPKKEDKVDAAYSAANDLVGFAPGGVFISTINSFYPGGPAKAIPEEAKSLEFYETHCGALC